MYSYHPWECIVAIFTATYSLEKNIRNNVDKLGDKIIYVQKWPWTYGNGYKWWEYMNRPKSKIKEYQRLARDSNKEIVKNTAFYYEFSRNKIGSIHEELSDVKIIGVMGDFFEINQWEVFSGRVFNIKVQVLVAHNTTTSLLCPLNLLRDLPNHPDLDRLHQ